MSHSPAAPPDRPATAPPPRLHVLMRPETTKAVVLRRGGSKVFCSIGWDLATDRFSIGQWCRHKLYPHRCDLSPDGRWMVYFALNGRYQSETRGTWTAVSRAPYLKAVCLEPQGHTWGGGGLFISDGEAARSKLGRLFASLAGAVRFRLEPSAGYKARLQRDGWRLGADGFEKPIGRGWALLKLVRGEPKELHRLRRPDGTLSELLRWEWAEFDAPRRRLVWAEQGTIRCAPVEPEGVGAVRELFDARPLSFEPLAAPYSDETVFLKP